MKSFAIFTIVCMVAIASLIAVQSCEAAGPRLNPRIQSRAFSREFGRQQAQSASFGVRAVRVQNFHSFHGPSVRVVPNGTRVLIVR